jgi:hypothetical protein
MGLAADSQRERAVGVLTRAYTEGKLELAEFEARAARALEATSTWELAFHQRGLLADDYRRRALRAARIAAAVVVWFCLSSFLAISFLVAVIASGAAAWTLAFPLVWLAVTVLAVRDVRRAR